MFSCRPSIQGKGVGKIFWVDTALKNNTTSLNLLIKRSCLTKTLNETVLFFYLIVAMSKDA
jgi:hypothetical protein